MGNRFNQLVLIPGITQYTVEIDENVELRFMVSFDKISSITIYEVVDPSAVQPLDFVQRNNLAGLAVLSTLKQGDTFTYMGRPIFRVDSILQMGHSIHAKITMT